MFDRSWRQHIEERQASLQIDVNGLRTEVGAIGGKIDKLVEGMSSTDTRASEHAHAVKREMREESDRRSKIWFNLLMAVVGMLGAVGLIVTALTGPWKEKLETTATGQSQDTAAIAAVREVLAQQGAEEGRLQSGQDIQRENGLRRDAQLREHDQSLAFMQGVMTAKGWPTK